LQLFVKGLLGSKENNYSKHRSLGIFYFSTLCLLNTYSMIKECVVGDDLFY
jgi:hypothetical protein